MFIDYKMEELLPVVGKLANEYTGFENSSVTYEKARQLMEAVLYCIHELDLSGKERGVSVQRISAQEAYDIGFICVREKVKRALDLYNKLLTGFS